MHHLDRGMIVLLAGGIGQPYVTTDYPAVQRALEILKDDAPDHLLEAGRLRLEHNQASLEELGALSDPVMTKDAVAGRIRRLLAMADKKAGELGVPDTESAVTPEMLAP
jgi:hypothetical protein